MQSRLCIMASSEVVSSSSSGPRALQSLTLDSLMKVVHLFRKSERRRATTWAGATDACVLEGGMNGGELGDKTLGVRLGWLLDMVVVVAT
jgi:hypothetical protein